MRNEKRNKEVERKEVIRELEKKFIDMRKMIRRKIGEKIKWEIEVIKFKNKGILRIGRRWGMKWKDREREKRGRGKRRENERNDRKNKWGKDLNLVLKEEEKEKGKKGLM